MENKDLILPTKTEKELGGVRNMCENNQVKTTLPASIPIDTRMIETLGALNDVYFLTFAKIHTQLETVPLIIYEKGIKASAKQYKSDLRRLKKSYKSIVRGEKRESKKKRRKDFFEKLKKKFNKKGK